MNEKQNTAPNAPAVSPRRGVVTGLVYLFEEVMPDPFVLSICLTLLVILLSLGLAPHGTLPEILTAWYTGTFNILGFALQMILILATGYAIAELRSSRAVCVRWRQVSRHRQRPHWSSFL
jgi:short-chain fatty acids transporter